MGGGRCFDGTEGAAGDGTRRRSKRQQAGKQTKAEEGRKQRKGKERGGWIGGGWTNGACCGRETQSHGTERFLFSLGGNEAVATADFGLPSVVRQGRSRPSWLCGRADSCCGGRAGPQGRGPGGESTSNPTSIKTMMSSIKRKKKMSIETPYAADVVSDEVETIETAEK